MSQLTAGVGIVPAPAQIHASLIAANRHGLDCVVSPKLGIPPQVILCLHYHHHRPKLRCVVDTGGSTVPARNYSALAATVFALVAIAQFVRAFGGWPVVVGSVDIPVGASWVAFLGASLLAVLGYLAALRD